MDREKRERQLYNYFSGELSVQEMTEVEAWMQASEENAREFATFRQTFLEMRWGMRVSLVKETQEGFQQKVRIRQRRRLLKRVTTWAAVVVCGIGIGLAWELRSADKADEQPEVATITPGRVQAQLVLSSNETVLLDKNGRMLIEANGTAIEVDSNGGIKYAQTQTVEQTAMLYNTVITPRGGEFTIKLADGTRVWLNAETELRYPIVFAGDIREVFLKGEAYFEVAKDNRKPFVVKASGIAVQVYGTSFNVNNYDEWMVETVLVNGSVGLSKVGAVDGCPEVKLEPGQKGTSEQGKDGFRVETVDVYTYTAWKDGNFVFENEPLNKIMNKLARWYNVEVFYARETARTERLSGDMMRYQDIQSLLYYFEKISDVQFEIKGRTIVVK